MKNFIPIPSDLRNSDEMIDLLMNEHCAGYGAFFMILGFLRECREYKTKADATRIAYAAQIQDVELCKRVLCNYGLFERLDGDFVRCPWLTEAMEAYEKKREKRAAAGRASAEARRAGEAGEEHLFNTCSTHVQQSSNSDSPNVKQHIFNKNPTNVSSKDTNQTNKSFAGAIDLGWERAVSGDFLNKICRAKEPGLSEEQRSMLLELKDEAHNPNCIIEICDYFGLGISAARFLMAVTYNAKIGAENLVRVLRIMNEHKKDPFEVKYPMNYIISKLKRDGSKER